MKRRSGRLVASAGLYTACVVVGTLMFLVGSRLVGYLPYSDRPGPGWHSGGLTWEEMRFFLSWSVLLLPTLAIWGVALAFIGQILGGFRAPRWFIGVLGAVVGGYLALVTVAGIGWYIAIAAAPVYAAGASGLFFGAVLFPRWSVVGEVRAKPTGLHWLAISLVTALVVGGVYIRFLSPHYVQQLSLEFVRVDPADQPIGASLERSSLSVNEKALLTKLFPVGVVRFGMSASAGGSGGAQARMLVVITGSIPSHSILRQPKGGALIYVQSGPTWKRYPEQSPLLSEAVELWPGVAKGTVRVKYWSGDPMEFAFVVPRAL